MMSNEVASVSPRVNMTLMSNCAKLTPLPGIISYSYMCI